MKHLKFILKQKIVLTYRQTDETEAETDRWTGGRKDRQMNRRTEGQTDDQADGRTDSWMNRQTVR